MATRIKEKHKSNFPSNIGNPARSALEAAGYFNLGQLTRVTEQELLKLHGMGPRAMGFLKSALEARGLSFAGADRTGAVRRKGAVPTGKTDEVNKFMDKLRHPLKKEIQFVRDVIQGTDKNIAEEIKWKAPSFSYKGEYLVTFNLWEQKHIHLVFHNPMISMVKSKILEGDYDHRRMVHFADMKDIKAKKPALEKALKELIKLQKKGKRIP